MPAANRRTDTLPPPTAEPSPPHPGHRAQRRPEQSRREGTRGDRAKRTALLALCERRAHRTSEDAHRAALLGTVEQSVRQRRFQNLVLVSLH